MNDFIKRNMPIFVIGGFTLLLFVFIIITASRQQKTEPKLTIVDENELLPSHTYYKGPSDAKVTIVEFSDYGCPYCKIMHPVIEEIYLKYPTKVKWAFRHFPLTGHKNSDIAAEAAQIAGEQNKFWEYTDKLFENQGNFSKEELIKYATELGLDVEKFKSDFESGNFKGVVKEDYNQALKLQLQGTPTFFLNGRLLDLSQGTIEDFANEIVKEIEKVEASESTSGLPLETVNTETKNLDYTFLNPIDKPVEFDKEYPEITIDFTDSGFNPGQTQAFEGQKVTWNNKATETLFLVQTYSKIKELENEVPIEPGKSFTVRMQGQKLWMYKDTSSGNLGSIFIKAVDSVYDEN